ncbi:Hsp20/alpha crystallin family protein [Oceanidesulfovibrio indonesiensis]|jgi:HSP20 family molecular chaperone IbpA|uniref:Hsp20/alpha crystallin family protein n=1 Tax=Oceanidesulfovibrio indonesiensis TaxID=54767 RepID=A0A7M3MB17_9BACT|nr:Hsp20/alpha crystallin family protein [Oceanidesulfovibrio indonesiensis]TVM14829.1 Hsp20/alpha crystallin family protein [Oceanidesulfovibrio indonesiensis]
MAAHLMKRDKETRDLPRYRPATDIIEMADGFHIFMDVPGVVRDTLSIDLNENELVVTARTSYKADPSEHARPKYLHMEFGGGEYRRVFTISDDVDRQRITAHLENGVLELVLPRAEDKTPKRIDISTG